MKIKLTAAERRDFPIALPSQLITICSHCTVDRRLTLILHKRGAAACEARHSSTATLTVSTAPSLFQLARAALGPHSPQYDASW